MKKLLHYCLVFSLAFSLVFVCKNQVSYAMGNPSIIENLDNEEVVSEKTLDLINELYSERRILAKDYEENQKEIEQLDKKIEQLGVVTLSEKEIEEKSKLISKTGGDIENSQRVAVSSAKDTRWTSVRQNTVYNGKEYQLQIIRGIPTSENSTLYKKDTSYSKSSSGFVAGSKNVLRLAISEGVSATGTVASSAITFYQAFSEFISGLKPTSSVGETECTYTTAISVEVVYIFVKYKGALDEDQVICYMGNSVEGTTAVSTPTGTNIDGKFMPDVSSKKYSYTMNSEGYNLSSSYACEAFYNYNRKYNYHYLYNIGRINLKAIGADVVIIIPKVSLNGN
ncbi:MAG: hypothetical protein HFH68_04295 [Lachnospiraceae bacterium]|nr:hypothetical protein [Lachnospiraceae bacterium]